MTDTTQTVETVQPVAGKLKFGIAGLNNPTPMWVTWIFRTEFVMNKAILLWLGATSIVKGDAVKEMILILGIADFATWSIGRFVGVKKADFEG